MQASSWWLYRMGGRARAQCLPVAIKAAIVASNQKKYVTLSFLRGSDRPAGSNNAKRSHSLAAESLPAIC